MFGPEFENIKEYKPYDIIKPESEIKQEIIDNEVDNLLKNKQLKPEIKLSDKLIEKKEEKPIIESKEEPESNEEPIIERKEEPIIEKKEIKSEIKEPISIKMFGPEFENIKEYKPYENKLEINEDIIDNEVDKLENIQNKPKIKSEEKKTEILDKEKPLIEKEKIKSDIKKPIISIKMFGPQFRTNKKYKPYINKLEISEKIIDNEVDKLFENKQNKPEIKDKFIEKKEEKPIIKDKESLIDDKREVTIKQEMKEEITQTEIIKLEEIISSEIKETKKPIFMKMFGPEFETNKEYKPYENKLEISEDIIENKFDKLLENKQIKPKIKSEVKSSDKHIEKSEEPIIKIKEPIIEKKEIKSEIKDIKMFGPEFENIKEYKPYINKLEISEDIIDNEVDKLENKQNKPEITEIKKDEKLLIEEKDESTKEIKEKIIQTELTKQEIEDIKKPISIKMFGPEVN